MKANSEKHIHVPLEKDEHLFDRITVLLTADLGDPQIESSARKLLARLRKRGYALPDFDLEDNECVSCLYLTLECAADLTSSNPHLH
jgi:hypothetical protein